MRIDMAWLCRVSLFQSLEPDDRAAVAERLVERSYRRGQVVFAESDTSRFMYIVAEGRVKVSQWLPSGREVLLAHHPAGDWFGEMGLIDGGTEEALVTALEPTRIWSLAKADFDALLQRPGFSRALLASLVGRCRDAWQQIERLSYPAADARLRLTLASLGKKSGRAEGASVALEPRPSHRELASLAGLSRETATRTMRRLELAGLIAVEGRRLTIHDLDQLLDGGALE